MSGEPSEQLTCCIGKPTYLKESRSELAPILDRRDWEHHDRDVVQLLLSLSTCSTCAYSQPDFPIVRGGKATIVFHSAEQVRPLLTEAIEGYVKDCMRMVAALQDSSFNESAIRSKVRISISDQRQTKAVPIPFINAGVDLNIFPR